MPSRNIVKQYVEGGYYHAYNRGVEKRKIFLDSLDYRVFLKLLRIMLSEQLPQKDSLRMKNYFGEVDLVAYCLMPNHFHLCLRQESEAGMQGLMRSLLTAYSMYFNKRYQRVGSLFQGPYKAALVQSDEYLMYLSKYIHRNPQSLGRDFENYEYSSYKNYVGSEIEWVKSNLVLRLFRDSASYRDFSINVDDPGRVLGDLTLE